MTSHITAASAVVRYRPDLADLRSKPILIGVVVQVNLGDSTAFGILAPEKLPPDQLKRLDAIGRKKLESPSKFLRKELDRCAAPDPEKCLEALAHKHCWSLHFEEPKPLPIPAEVAADHAPPNVLRWLVEILVAEAEKMGLKVDLSARESTNQSKPASASRQRRKSAPSRYVFDTHLQQAAAM